MHTFIIDGITYLPHSNSLFIIQDEVTEISELNENQFYLHKGSVGVFELPADYMSFNAIFNPRNSELENLHYNSNNQERLGDTFTTANPLERIVPDNLAECPECGSPAGDIEDEDSPTCFNCGFGT